MKRINILVLLVMSFVSCNFNQTYQNREDDKKEAEKVTFKFFSFLKDNDRKEIYKLFSNKFYQATSKNELDKMLDYSNQQGGKFTNYTLTNWQTLVIKGSNPKADYSLTYYVKRQYINTQEIFSLQKENDSIKIVGYKINLDVSNK